MTAANDDTFLSDFAIFRMTGYRQKRKQIAQLRKQGVPFKINASGHPVVARAAVEGGKVAPEPGKAWEPAWAASHR